MRRFILCAILAGMSLGLSACGSNPIAGPGDPTKPVPAEPPADGFVPKPAPK